MTVTHVAPDAATLLRMVPLGPGASIVRDAVKEFSCHPVVMPTRRCVQTPIAVRPMSALSDRQLVTSAADPDTRMRLVYAEEPTSTPRTVTLMAPETPAFAILALLGAAASSVKDAVKLFTRQPVVMTVRRCGQMPIDDRATTEVSERHAVVCDLVPPTRDGLL